MFQYLFPHMGANRATNRRIVEQAVALQQITQTNNHLLRIIHDLYAPLRAAVGALELARQQGQPSSWLHVAHINCQHIQSMTGIVMAAVDAADGSPDYLHHEPMQVISWLSDLYNMISSRARVKEVTVMCKLHDQLPDYILTDRVLLTRISMNLLEMAVSYAGADSEVLFACGCEGGQLALRIDCNCEIPVTEWDSPNGQLWLSVSRELAESIEGSLHAKSTTGKGTAFVVRVPLKPCDPPPAKRPSGNPVSIQVAVQGPHLLLIENEHYLNAVLAEQLLISGVATKITTAAGGRQGVLQAAVCLPDMIIMDDHQMDWDGIEVVRHLRGMVQFEQIPIIVHSVCMDEQRQLQYMELGGVLCLQGTLEIEVLQQAILLTLTAEPYLVQSK